MEMHEELENAHLLEQSPSTLSDRSGGSVSTVVESPYPNDLHQDWDSVHSAYDTIHERNLTPRESVPGTEGLALDLDGFRTPIAGPKNVEDLTSEQRLAQAPDPHANILARENDYKSQLKHNQFFNPFKIPSTQSPLLATTEEKNNPTFTKVPVPALEYGSGNPFARHSSLLVRIGIPIVAFYATAASGFWFSVAIWRPTWGHLISSSGITLPNASVACALVAKTIEVSFVAVFVAFLGQKLSRRASLDRCKGVSLAEIAMKAWVVQPGSILSHFELVQSAGLTYLGVMTLLVTVFATLYTSASNALVSPRLVLSKDSQQSLTGKVSTSFANVHYIVSQCHTPITTQLDPDYFGTTCNSIGQAGQGYYNFVQYLSRWTNHIRSGNLSTELRDRPQVPATLDGNITVEGSWVEIMNMTQISLDAGRTVNNVSLAFPHPGVIAAAQDERNGFSQTAEADLSGRGHYDMGHYDINASVTSPTVNVLCSSMTLEELEPLVYTRWPATNISRPDRMIWPAGVPSYPDWLNSTAIDDIFGFGERYGRRPPVFHMLPLAFNTVLNHTGEAPDSIYVLASTANHSYMMCSLRASLSVDCSTRYQASGSGRKLEAHCDPGDKNTYKMSRPDAPHGILQPDWSQVAAEWALAVALNGNANASTPRLLTELIPTGPFLNPSMPSIAEALAALAGSTLLTSAIDAPFVHYWDHQTHVLAEPATQNFTASVRTWQYQSKLAQRWQSGFFLVLFGTFAISFYCLQYLVRHRNLRADITELPTAFTLAMSSSSSRRSNNGIGSNSEKQEYKTRWCVNTDDSQYPYFETLAEAGSAECAKDV